MRCRSDVSRAFAYFHFLERPVTKIGGAGDHCHPGAPSHMPSSKQLNGDCSISPRFHFRCRARPRLQIVPNGLRLNAFMKGLAPPIRTNDRHIYCPMFESDSECGGKKTKVFDLGRQECGCKRNKVKKKQGFSFSPALRTPQIKNLVFFAPALRIG